MQTVMLIYMLSKELCGALTAHGSAWTRFQEYTSLVREIVIDPFVSTLDLQTKLLEDTFWFKLIASLGDAPILPRLEVVALYSSNSFQQCSFDMRALRLLNTDICELNIVFPTASAEHQSKLRKALTACVSSIEGLSVLSLEVPIPIMDTDSLPCLHSRLYQLRLGRQLDIHPNQLSLLASLPNLKHLSITLNPWALLDRPIAFRELHELEVFSTNLSAIGALITHTVAPHLRAFSLSETHQEGEGSEPRLARDLPIHLHMLATKWPTLTAFQWNYNLPLANSETGRGFGVGGSSDTLTELLTPLLSLRALRSFVASFYGFAVEYSPRDFRVMAVAWPALERFHLCDDMPRVRHHADLAALVAFARHCPRLRSLHLPMLKFDPVRTEDASSVAALQAEEPLAGARAHWLRELVVRCIIYPRRREGEEQGEDETVCAPELFQECVRKLFPEATLRYPVRNE